MKCIQCSGKLKRGVTPFHIDRKGYHLIFDEVPAWICEQCGEVYFDEPEVDTVQDATELMDNQIASLAVPA